jgi:hypothetical protein
MTSPQGRRRPHAAGQLAWLDVTVSDAPLDAGRADTPLDWFDDDVLLDDELEELLAVAPVVAAALAWPAAIAATRPVNATADTPVATHRARAAAWRRGPRAPARGGRQRDRVSGSVVGAITGHPAPDGYESGEPRRRIR